MAAGDVTISPIGIYDLSGAGLSVAGIANITQDQHLSGARIIMVPVSNGLQVAVYKVVRA